jgi:hypothetical protein
MTAPQEPRLNDDLLLSDDDREQASCSFPALIKVLDFPELRAFFGRYDDKANQTKKHLRLAGMTAIGLGAFALLGASAQPLNYLLPPVLSTAVIFLSPIAGFLSILISYFGVLNSTYKRTWLEDRLMTERLRQFQFQTLVFRMPAILSYVANPESADQFNAARNRWFSSFKMEYEGHLSAKLKEVLDDDPEDRFTLHEIDAAPEDMAGKEPALKELFAAYRLLRIKHQIQYANYKLGGDGLDFPGKQVSLLTRTSLICILIIFLMHFGFSIYNAVDFWNQRSFASDPQASVWNIVFHVLVIWTVIIALAARAFEEGLQPTREVERYTAYKARLERLLYHFDHASSLPDRVRLMTEVERLVYQEMRDFLKTNYEARFVL